MEKTRNILLTLRYDGRFFHGSAVQENAVTVQGVLQAEMARLTGEEPELKCCSRTDAFVHAHMFCVSIKTDCALPCERILAALNANLPEAVAVTGCREVPDDFHARYSCIGKRYLYRIHNSIVRDPFQIGLSCRYGKPLDEKMLDREAKAFLGTHDFSSFCSSGSSVEDKVRSITKSTVSRNGEMVYFEVAGNGFLYNMVRIMMGTLLAVGSGKLAPWSIPGIIASKDRKMAGPTAPPQGLYLEEVFYAETATPIIAAPVRELDELSV